MCITPIAATTMIILLVVSSVISAIIAAVVFPHLIDFSRESHLYDLPDSRKVHKIPVPRIGGAIFLPSVIITMSFVITVYSKLTPQFKDLLTDTIPEQYISYFSGAIILMLTGLYDDIWQTSYKLKFFAQIISASLLCISGLWISDLNGLFMLHEIPFWVGIPLSVVSIVFVTNAMNLIDGIDGLLSGITIIGLIANMLMSFADGDVIHAMLSASFMGAICVFYYYNVFSKTRKTFMGDSGSLTIGYALSFLTLHYWQSTDGISTGCTCLGDSSNLACIITSSTLIIPCFDVIRVFSIRIMKGTNPFLPDKRHIHHKLMQAGCSARTTLRLILTAVAAITLTNAALALHNFNITVIALIDAIAYSAMIFIAGRRGKNGNA